MNSPMVAHLQGIRPPLTPVWLKNARAKDTTPPVGYARAIAHVENDRAAAVGQGCGCPGALLGEPLDLAICIPRSGHLIARVVSGAGAVGDEWATH